MLELKAVTLWDALRTEGCGREVEAVTMIRDIPNFKRPKVIKLPLFSSSI